MDDDGSTDKTFADHIRQALIQSLGRSLVVEADTMGIRRDQLPKKNNAVREENKSPWARLAVVFRSGSGFSIYKFIHLLFLGRSYGRYRSTLFGLRLGSFLGQPLAVIPPGTGKVAAALLATLHSYLRLSDAVLDFDPQAFLSTEPIL